jgi:hypothetical protein
VFIGSHKRDFLHFFDFAVPNLKLGDRFTGKSLKNGSTFYLVRSIGGGDIGPQVIPSGFEWVY